MTNKELDKAIANTLGDPQSYDVRQQLRVVNSGFIFEDATQFISKVPENERHLWTITTSIPEPYSTEIESALFAAKRIAARNNNTFVLSMEDGRWKASFGDYGDCAEYTGGNPAYCICVAIMKYLGKL